MHRQRVPGMRWWVANVLTRAAALSRRWIGSSADAERSTRAIGDEPLRGRRHRRRRRPAAPVRAAHVSAARGSRSILLLAALVLSVFKLRLPLGRGNSTMSMAYAVDFVALIMAGPDLAMVVAAAGVLMQCTVRVKKRAAGLPHGVQRRVRDHRRARRAAGSGRSSAATCTTGHRSIRSLVVPLSAAAMTYFAVNTMLVAGAIALSSGVSALREWNREFFWSAPAYFLSAAVAAMVTLAITHGAYILLPLAASPLYLSYRAYRMSVGRIEEERRHAQELAGMIATTQQALARATESEAALAAEKEQLALDERAPQRHAADHQRRRGHGRPERHDHPAERGRAEAGIGDAGRSDRAQPVRDAQRRSASRLEECRDGAAPRARGGHDRPAAQRYDQRRGDRRAPRRGDRHADPRHRRPGGRCGVGPARHHGRSAGRARARQVGAARVARRPGRRPRARLQQHPDGRDRQPVARPGDDLAGRQGAARAPDQRDGRLRARARRHQPAAHVLEGRRAGEEDRVGPRAGHRVHPLRAERLAGHAGVRRAPGSVVGRRGHGPGRPGRPEPRAQRDAGDAAGGVLEVALHNVDARRGSRSRQTRRSCPASTCC